MPNTPRILIAVPCMDMVAAPFAQALATLQKQGECIVSFLIGSLIYDSRNQLAKQAVKFDCDYILWLDSDMTFPPDTLLRMLKHAEEGKDIVSGLYFRRSAPYTPVLFKTLSEYKEGVTWEDYNDYPEDSVFEIGGCGFGCVLTKKEIFLEMVLEGMPFFNPTAGLGEDIAFCLRAHQLGHKIWCDSTIKCGHVGHITVSEALYKASR